MKVFTKALVALGILLFPQLVKGQSQKPLEQILPPPLWYQMINDTTTNFNDAVKAFKDFFENRELPEEPGERFGYDFFEQEFGLGEARKREETLKSTAKGDKRENENEQNSGKSHSQKYALEVKAFKSWYFDAQTWLRPDGSIVGPKERQVILDAQRRELKEIESRSKRN